MTGSPPAAHTIQEWIDHDPDPVTAAELRACSEEELAQRFSEPLVFGTAGLRGTVRGGPNGMNLAVVLRTTYALAKVLKDRCLGGSTVVVGRDARHGSEKFAQGAAEVLAAEGFKVVLLPRPLPTPVLAFAVRHVDAAAGVQITASHNPPADNGYKVYWSGGAQIISPTDRDIESTTAAAPFADQIPRIPVTPTDNTLVDAYIQRAATVRRGSGGVRVALTALHGVGGATALATLNAAGIKDIHVVDNQFQPDPDFPTVAFPNPEEPGAADAVLTRAAEVDADLAIALDPDADRCAIGIPSTTGWRMLSGDETGWLLGDYILSTQPHSSTPPVVASTVVSSRMLARIAASLGARHVETLTGFKWLVRAADFDLVYAYEEAIGHCVDPAAVRDKDGISAAVLACDLVTHLRELGTSVEEKLENLAIRHGIHVTSQVSLRMDSLADITAMMTRLRANLPAALSGFPITAEDLLERRGQQRTDAVILAGEIGGSSIRLVIRPSGTEPKVKCYIEVREPVITDATVARIWAGVVVSELEAYARNI
ncbi:phospho-sugar mutase [Mycobacteroides salmoniphilum]|uniref:phospho-sugar mutase n=1 Tax=Mycobacteroides salmoniphilum TaxID=404941 RepID=UPI001066BFAF|nr:phospho-sugar mutase [Mycobacteroides salmoniphilum]TDZ75567.1 putative phosphomannomutase [Mycobacteroides salmoniphilum]TDZ84086.1 putative phosphomannomutase [Mycobacteroides salmoniphilum]